MVTATITSKGQVTLPKAVRTFLHLRAGDRIGFLLYDDSEARIRPLTKSVKDLYGKLSRHGQSVRSVEDMHKAVAQRMRKRHR